jgi:predicted metal-dependent hydrolase
MPQVFPFEYKIRRNSRVKKARIVVKPASVEVVVPHNFPETEIKRFVTEKYDWISKALVKLEKQQSNQKLAPEIYEEGSRIPFLGQHYPLLIQYEAITNIKIEFNERFTLCLPLNLPSSMRSDAIRFELIQWMHHYALEIAYQLVDKYRHLYQLQPRSIRMKTQKSRWGSCGIHNDINLNWVLILAPMSVFEYVFVHEICHIKHRNHSAVFWGLVAEHMPDYNKHRGWLRDNGSALMQGL